MSTLGLAISSVLGFGLPGHGEWIVLLILGLLIFGRRLPEVGRSIGRSIVEFKKGIKGIEDEIEEESSKSSRKGDVLPDDSDRRQPLPDQSSVQEAEAQRQEEREKQPVGRD